MVVCNTVAILIKCWARNECNYYYYYLNRKGA